MTQPLHTIATGVHAAYMAQLYPSWRRLHRSLHDPERAQRARLAKILELVADQPYGQSLGLKRTMSAEALTRVAPVVRYDDLEPWIARMARGERQILSAAGVTMFERSSGSSAASKLIPYNAALLAEFAEATQAWLFDLFWHRPALIGKGSYWSISPVTQARQKSEGGIDIGVEDDTEYFNPLTRWALKQMMVAPSELAREVSFERWRHRTLLHLLEAERLGFVSIWNPTFWTLLMSYAEQHIGALIDGLSAPRARAVARSLDAHGDFSPEHIWPHLGLISMWADASARHFLPELRGWLPTTELQPKGLLATEGVITIPWSAARANLLAIQSHFYEFIELGSGDQATRYAWQLELGKEYSPLLTTSAGLVRYELRDVVRCVGHHHKTPLLRFEGKLDRTSDLCGEKLNARQVEGAITQASRALPYKFALLAPSRTPAPHYRLYIEPKARCSSASLEQLRQDLEASLEQNHHYAQCKTLGQLGPLVLVPVVDGAQTYLETLRAHGMRAGDIKPSQLDHRLIWDDQFTLALVTSP